jgi:superfamily I DNA/RNA helicase
MVAYQRDLHGRGWVDWSDIPRRMWKFMQDGILHPPTYDIIHVDEAQFFAPIWFELVKHILKPSTGYLFMVADPTQGFLKRRQSWLASGLEVRGRAQRLEKSYRTTREILTFAMVCYQLQIPQDDEDLVAPQLAQMPHGPLPQLIPLTSGQDEITRVVNEIQALIQADIPLKHILVLHTTWLGVERLLTRLRSAFGETAAMDPKEQRHGNHIRVCTLNAATGLESPIVFLLGAHTLLEETQSLRLTEEERQDVVRDHARRLYMAMTRAGQRLVITYVGDLPDLLHQAQALTVQQSGGAREERVG